MSKSNGPSSKPAAPLYQPSLPWRMTSSLVMGLTAALSRGFLYTFNTVEVTGLDQFLDVLDKRKDVEKREKGLITVSNHISVLDDPLMWGVLPLRYAFNPSNFRWGLGAHDICYKNKALGSFFYCGQVLPTHRGQHSPHGGLFQPTMSHAIRLLSSPPFITPRPEGEEGDYSRYDLLPDPFTSGDGLTYTTNGTDRHPAPAAAPSWPLQQSRNRHAWVHVFPEACVHQHPAADLRYFKWGVSRLILESEPAPDVVPVFIDGTQRAMSEDRGFPRFLPRPAGAVRVAFGDLLDAERAFGDLRARWRDLVRRSSLRDSGTGSDADSAPGLPPSPLERKAEEGGEGQAVVTAAAKGKGKGTVRAMGDLTDELKYGREAVEIRIECARRVRAEVAKLRRRMGYPEGEPDFELAETWAGKEPGKDKYKSGVDESLNKRK
ncbi:Lyso-phosphatidylcholine acyltransferase [Diatrype stigma]|uniref:Tafazzin family protein n=1 Tax=Diatrype stigma TaxID=117547 RepID=A0AAN9UJW9_9PEZI